MTTATQKLTIAQLLAAHADQLKPSIGDKAYTKYHGRIFRGIITHINERGHGLIEPENTKEDWGYHTGTTKQYLTGEDTPVRGLFFGYDDAVVWDANTGCWYAPADLD